MAASWRSQLDKHRWQVRADPAHPLVLHYEVYAFDASVRTAFLDSTRGFFNPTSLCLRCRALRTLRTLHIGAERLPTDWQVATALAPLETDRPVSAATGARLRRTGRQPVRTGPVLERRLQACGVPHRFVVSGAGGWFDGERLLDDTRRICEQQIRFWHGDGAPPFDRYVFMLHASADGYGGPGAPQSTALIVPGADLPAWSPNRRRPTTRGAQADRRLHHPAGLISHEYFHTWNVKRLRPAEFRRYDYDRENYTELLWFFEGFTSYYDDLLLRRAGLIDDAAYLQLLAKTINQVLQTPGRHVQSVAQASFDAWVKYYRVGENTPTPRSATTPRARWWPCAWT
jgi:predicted metalloprotease with PDZ domain